MARGMGGEDGPSLWMFAACVLIWYKLSELGTKAKNTLEDKLELGKNSAGPFQPESTKQISEMEREVARIVVTPSRLKHKLSHYADIADMCWDELKAVINTDEGKLFAALEPLTVYELRAVAKEFGVRETTFFHFTTQTVTLVRACKLVLTDGVTGNDLSRMRKIWAKAGLWA